jgi:hypothetical protein
LNKSRLIILSGLSIIFVLIVYTVVFSNIQQNSFSDGSISFNYPAGFENDTSPEVILYRNGSWVDVAFFSNMNGISIDIDKNEQFSGNVYAAMNASENEILRIDEGRFSSTSAETNPNDIKIFTVITTIRDPFSTEVFKGVDYYFQDNQIVIYGISVYDVESDYQQVKNTGDTIFNSLKLS